MSKVKLLLVEDCLNNQELYKLILGEKFQISTANNAKEAIECLDIMIKQQRKPDIILMDKLMPPGIDGMRATELIKNNILTCDIPVVIFTASPEHKDAEMALKVGASLFLTKDTPREKLIEQLLKVYQS
jgi:CheY-like chemotaxis protein